MHRFKWIKKVPTILILASLFLPSAALSDDPSAGIYRGCSVTLEDNSIIAGYVFHSLYGDYYPRDIYTSSAMIQYFPQILSKYGEKFKLIKDFQQIIAPKPLYAYTSEDEIIIYHSKVKEIRLDSHPLDQKVSRYNSIRLSKKSVETLKNKPQAAIFRDEGQACPDPRALVSYNPDIDKVELGQIWENEIREISWKTIQQDSFNESLWNRRIIHITLFGG